MNLTADSHIRVNYRQAKDTGLLSTLTERSVFDAERYWRRLARAPRTRKATFTHTPYEIHGSELWIPRGLMGWLRKLPFPLQVTDSRISIPLYKDLPAPDVRDYQAAAADFVVENQQCLLWAPTGCLSGDTVIECNRAGRSFKRTIRDLYTSLHDSRPYLPGRGNWDPSILTQIRVRSESGEIRLHAIKEVFHSGEKQTFRLGTSCGKSIVATKDHRFLTSSGWVRLEEIEIGDAVFVDKGLLPSAQNQKKKPNYRQASFLHFHPYAGRRGCNPQKSGFSRPYHILVAEAKINSIGVRELITILRTSENKAKKLSFLDPKVYAVHHLDENPLNNHPDNLEVLTHFEHHKRHGEEGGWRHVTGVTGLSTIVDITQLGIEETFDIEMDGEPRNFLANGFVVHNSGKTRIMSSIIQRIKERTCIIVNSLDIMEQVVDELRLSLEIVPGVRGGGEDFEGLEVSVCQAQSFRNWTDEKWADFTKGYGCVMIDECHQAHRKLAEKFPAKYRIGLTATPDVVMDSSETVQWIFGKKFAVADHQGLVDQGYRVQPIFDWLHSSFTVDNPSDYGALLDALVVDRPRAELICKDVRAKWIEGRSVLVLCGRIAYGKALIDILSGLGVPSTLLTSDTGRNARREALDKARKGEIKVLVATSLADCGLDVPLLDTLYLAFPGRSTNLTHQRIGRVLRRAPDKGEPLVIDVVDDFVPTLFSQALHREAAMKTYGELPKRLVRERKRDRKPEF